MRHPSETAVYRAVGDCLIKADVYRTARRGAARATVILIHGGALMFGSRSGVRQEHLVRYLDSGYDVVSIDYRLAPESKLAEIIDDVREAFAWVASLQTESGGAGSGAVAAVGHSAGGYLALMSGFRCVPRPRAIVSFYGYGDIVAPWYTEPSPFYCTQPLVSDAEAARFRDRPPVSEVPSGSGRERFYLYCRQRGLWPLEVSGHDPAQEPSYFTGFCPLRNVTGDYPPTMLLHGDRDTDVPCEQSLLMARELERHGVPCELHRMKGYGHGFDHDTQDPAVRDAIDRAISFIATHTS